MPKKGLALPLDLLGMEFMACRAENADYLWALGNCPLRLSIWLSKLQEVCGSIGLDVSVSKTEWLYLSKPNSSEKQMHVVTQGKLVLAVCRSNWGDAIIKHTLHFTYIGIVISESGGVIIETEDRVGKHLRFSTGIVRYSRHS